jgi:hypothetical protein
MVIFKIHTYLLGCPMLKVEVLSVSGCIETVLDKFSSRTRRVSTI